MSCENSRGVARRGSAGQGTARLAVNARKEKEVKMAKKKRVVIMSDLHCGHVVGLTPTKWQFEVKGNKEKAGADGYSKRDKWGKIQKELWDEYMKLITALQPIDVLIVNGDMIDGKGVRSGGTELITSDRDEQAEMASCAIRLTMAKKKILTFGTAYHTGTDEDWENQIAREVEADKIGSHEWVDVNGLIFDVKHHIGASQIPHGRHTAIARDRLWNTIWSEHEEQPKATVLIRSHVHYFSYAGGDDWLGLTTPALQGMGSKFGARRMSGHIDWGLVSFDVVNKDEYTWQYHIKRLSAQKASPLKV